MVDNANKVRFRVINLNVPTVVADYHVAIYLCNQTLIERSNVIAH